MRSYEEIPVQIYSTLISNYGSLIYSKYVLSW